MAGGVDDADPSTLDATANEGMVTYFNGKLYYSNGVEWVELDNPLAGVSLSTLSADNILGNGADLRVDIESFGPIIKMQVAFDYKETGAVS